MICSFFADERSSVQRGVHTVLCSVRERKKERRENEKRERGQTEDFCVSIPPNPKTSRQTNAGLIQKLYTEKEVPDIAVFFFVGIPEKCGCSWTALPWREQNT